jgi:hypothetical protein
LQPHLPCHGSRNPARLAGGARSRGSRLPYGLPNRWSRGPDQILQSNPSDFNALANRGVGFRTGEYDRAVADFNQARRLDPKDVAALSLERGMAYAGSGDSQTAITDLSEALRRDSSLVQAYLGGRSLTKRSDSTTFPWPI